MKIVVKSAAPKLSELFGDHTFLLNANGLNIVEPAESSQEGVQTWKVVKLASWKDATQTSLTSHKPEPTNVVIALPSNVTLEFLCAAQSTSKFLRGECGASGRDCGR